MSARRRFGLGGVPAQFGLVIIIAAFWTVFAWRAPGFLSPFNLFSVGRALAVDIVIGFAQMAALATGGMNLSVGSIGVCAVMTGGYLMQTLGIAGSGRHSRRARARRGARLAQWLRHRAQRRQRLHHHAGERQSLLRRHAHPDQGGPAQQPADGSRRVRKNEDRRPRLAAARHRSGDRLAAVRLLSPFRFGPAHPRRRRQRPRRRNVGRAGRSRHHDQPRALGSAGGDGRHDGGRASWRGDAGGRRRGLAAALFPRARARRHAAFGRSGGGRRHDARRLAGDDDPQRAPGAADRQLLAPALPRRDPASRRSRRPLSRALQERRGIPMR